MNIFKKIQLNHRQKAIISSLIGVIVLIILIGILGLFAWEDNFLKFLLPLKQMIYPLIGGTIWEFSHFFTIPLSFLGIFLGIKSLKSPRRALGFFAIILNSINLIFALFIAWFLFGLARGM
jgi:hypothetical protein